MDEPLDVSVPVAVDVLVRVCMGGSVALAVPHAVRVAVAVGVGLLVGGADHVAVAVFVDVFEAVEDIVGIVPSASNPRTPPASTRTDSFVKKELTKSPAQRSRLHILLLDSTQKSSLSPSRESI